MQQTQPLKENNEENKKAKDTKKSAIKNLNLKIRNLKFENCLEAAKIEEKIKHLEKNKIDVDDLKEDHKEFIKKQKTNIKNTTKI